MALTFDEIRTERGSRVNILGPRGIAKSTWCSLALPLRAACEATEPYIMLLSDSTSQAKQLLDDVKDELEVNERIAEEYPEAFGQGPTWAADSIVLRNRVRIDAMGSGKKVRGRRHGPYRPSLIIADDLQNDDSVVSATMRSRDTRWWKRAVMKCGAPDTNFMVVSSALHSESIAMELARTPAWRTRIYKSIVTWPRNMDLWQQWEDVLQRLDGSEGAAERADANARAFYEANRAVMDEGAVVLWPEREPLYDLMMMRAVDGHAAFESEKQSNPINPDDCEFDASYFGDWMWFDEWPTDLRIKTLALDPSKGADARRGDYSAIIKLGRTPDGMLYVEADIERRPTSTILDASLEHYRAFAPDAFGIETNQFQSLLATDLYRIADERRLIIGVVEIDNRVKKTVRIRRLEPYLCRRRFRIKRNAAGVLLVKQLQEFPVADHDDGPDALEMALRMAIAVDHGEIGAAASDGLGDYVSL